MNMLATITPKSDQLNSDDLIGRTMTIKVTKVSLLAEEQPVAVHFEGDNGKPFKPCKSMRRVMVNVWGPDASAYAGRSMALYRDDKVQFGGLAVGGIRISHMSNIDQPVTMALTATRANRKPFTVKPLVVDTAPKRQTWGALLDALEAELMAAPDAAAVGAIVARDDVRGATLKSSATVRDRLNAMVQAALDRTVDHAPDDDTFPGDLPTRESVA